MASIRKQVIFLNILAFALWLFELFGGRLADYLGDVTKALNRAWVVPILARVVPILEIAAVLLVLVFSIALFSNQETKDAIRPKTWFILPIALPLIILARELMVIYAYVLIMNW